MESYTGYIALAQAVLDYAERDITKPRGKQAKYWKRDAEAFMGSEWHDYLIFCIDLYHHCERNRSDVIGYEITKNITFH